MGKKYSETTSIPETGIAARDRILKALERSGFRNIRFIEETEIYLAETSVSLWSWAENIHIATTVSENKTRLEFTSKCALPTQIIDWGKNKNNTLKFIHNIQNG